MSEPIKLVTNSYLLTKAKRARKEVLQKAEAAHNRAEIEIATANDPAEVEFTSRDAYWARRIGSELVRKYPGHGWNVLSDIRSGIVKIYNQHSTARVGYIWKTKDINATTFARDVMRIGGEMLRRSNIKSDVMDPEEIMALQKANLYNNLKVDLS